MSYITVKFSCKIYDMYYILAELSRKRCRSCTRRSDDLVLQQSVAKKSLPDCTSTKMDLFARDMSDLHFESDPEVIIKLLYDNALATISDLLEPHLKAVKKEAGRLLHLGLHHVALTEDIIESADSVDSLFKQMSVTRMYYQTRFLIPHQYVHNVIQRSGRLDAVWILLELDIIEVSIPGVFTFIPSVGCFLSLLRGSKPFTADLLGVTEVRDLCNA